MKDDKDLRGIKLILCLSAIFLANVAPDADLVLVPITNALFTAFPDSGMTVNYIISGPSLICLLASLLTGKLLQYFNKKLILLIGFAFFAVGGIFGVVVENQIYIAVMRTLVGFGFGVVGVSTVAIITSLFSDEKQRSTYVGLNIGFMAAIGGAFSLIGGFVALSAWQSVFKIYLVAVPILVMIILFIPGKRLSGKQDEPAKEQSANIKSEPIPWKSFFPVVLSAFVLNLIFGGLMYFLSVYLAENGIGDSSTTGIISVFGTISNVLICMFFGMIYSKMKSGTIVISFILYAIVFLGLMIVENTIFTGVMYFLFGAAFGLGFSYFFMHSTVVVPESQASFAIGIINAVSGFGTFVCTYLISLTQSVFNVDTVTATFPVFIGLAVLFGILTTVIAIRDRN